MGNLPNAEMSPRIVNGVLYWYEGDTFQIDINIDLVDQDDDPIYLQPTDTVNIQFSNDYGNTVKSICFTNISDNSISLIVDSDFSALFPAGKYTYDVVATNSCGKRTVANNNKVVVEE